MQYYQEALFIYQQHYNGCYHQGLTYGELGLLLESLGNLDLAKTNYLQALQIFIKFKDDQYYLGFTLYNLSRLYKTTRNETILAEIASILDCMIEEVKERFKQIEKEEE